LILKAKLRVSDLTGKGAYLSLRGSAPSEIVFDISSASLMPFNDDFAEYSIKLDYYPEQIENLSLFLTLDGATSGTVFFEDIRLIDYY